MELTQGSEKSANYNLMPGKYPKEHLQYSNHGESLKSRICVVCFSCFYVSSLARGRVCINHTCTGMALSTTYMTAQRTVS
jgi:hypothetical protein